MIGYYNYTVILTYIGTLFGFTGITYIWNGNLRIALLCLIGAGICDMFDGKIASTKKRTKEEKRFGIQIDSLSDVICFGVLPALIIYHCGGKGMLNNFICGTYMLCALIRLAWFNVDEEMRQDTEDGSREGYRGLPVTTSALLIPFFIGLGNCLSFNLEKVYPLLLLLVGAMFLTPFHTKKPHLIGKLAMIIIGAMCFKIVMIGVKV